MATILAHIHVHAGQESAFEALAAELHRDTHRLETGVRRYEYWRGAEPGLYYGLLAFDDFHAFLRHQTSAHHETASPKLGDVIARMKLEWVDPLGTASDLPPTNEQELPEDADDFTRRTARLFAPEVQGWWLQERD
jgi:quinol monooxygenase YgiN